MKLTAEQLRWSSESFRAEADLRRRNIRAHITRLDVNGCWERNPSELLVAAVDMRALYDLAEIYADEAERARIAEESKARSQERA